MKEIDELLKVGTYAHVASKFKLKTATVYNHDTQHRKGRRGPSTAQSSSPPPVEPPKVEAPKPPILPPTASALERAQAQCAFLDARLAHAVAHEDARGVATLSGQRTSALRLLAKLQGGTDITEAMVIRSPAAVRLRAQVLTALSAHPEALRAVIAAFEDFENGR